MGGGTGCGNSDGLLHRARLGQSLAPTWSSWLGVWGSSPIRAETAPARALWVSGSTYLRCHEPCTISDKNTCGGSIVLYCSIYSPFIPTRSLYIVRSSQHMLLDSSKTTASIQAVLIAAHPKGPSRSHISKTPDRHIQIPNTQYTSIYQYNSLRQNPHISKHNIARSQTQSHTHIFQKGIT